MDEVMIGKLIGKNVFVRTVTMYYTGLLVAMDNSWLRLDKAAWIPDTGKFSRALETGELREVEPYPYTCWVSRDAVVDICEWAHELPRKEK